MTSAGWAHEHPAAAAGPATVVLADNPSEMTFEGTNTYVLRAPGATRSVVVDPGPAPGQAPQHTDAVVAAAGEVELIVVTHRHADHTGGIDALHRASGAPVRALAAEHCRDAGPLADGEVLRAGGLDLRVLATPGHTADSVSLHVRGDDGSAVAVLGDTLLGHATPVLDPDDGDLGRYLESLALLAELDGVPGLCGHGPVLDDTAAAARAVAEHRRGRLEQVRRARAELGPDADAAALTRHVYAGEGLSEFLLAVAERSTEVALAYLRRGGE